VPPTRKGGVKPDWTWKGRSRRPGQGQDRAHDHDLRLWRAGHSHLARRPSPQVGTCRGAAAGAHAPTDRRGGGERRPSCGGPGERAPGPPRMTIGRTSDPGLHPARTQPDRVQGSDRHGRRTDRRRGPGDGLGARRRQPKPGRRRGGASASPLRSGAFGFAAGADRH
jgi:hypothetical protein